MQRQRAYLKAETIYRYLLGLDDEVDTLIMCKSSEVELVTTDQSVYEAIGAVEDKSKISLSKLTKLLEVTEILPFRETMKRERSILSEERAGEIRKQGVVKEDDKNGKKGNN